VSARARTAEGRSRRAYISTLEARSVTNAPTPPETTTPSEAPPEPAAAPTAASDPLLEALPEEMDMAALLDSAVGQPRQLNRGDVIEGVIMNVERDGLLVDIGFKSEGIVPTGEMHSLGSDPLSKLNVGDKLLVFVVQPETADGQVGLSVDRARGEQGWLVLQDRFESGEIFDAEITGYNKGGLLANVEGVNAFIPMSQVVGAKPGSDGANPLSAQVGRGMRLKVIEINRRRNRVILSERAAMQEWRAEQKERLLQELTEGEIRTGTVTSIRNFGVFVDLGGADGLVHLSELSWDRNAAPEDLFKVGSPVSVYVMKVDQESKKIALSIRRASPEQWEELITRYTVGDVVPGVVTKIVPFGAFTRIPGPVEGLVHVSEVVDRRIAHPEEVLAEGDVVPVKIVRIEHDRHRLGLSLREGRHEAELRGWHFDDDGRVVGIGTDGVEEFAQESAESEQRLALLREGLAERRAQRAEQAASGGGTATERGGAAPPDEGPVLTAMQAAMKQAQEQLETDRETDSPTAEATEPTAEPTAEVAEPTAEPTEPTAEPTAEVAEPTAEATEPTAEPTAEVAEPTTEATEPTAEAAEAAAETAETAEPEPVAEEPPADAAESAEADSTSAAEEPPPER
jgi:small subunit ribosomal protein S1